jgi:DNA-3-methyladenine glycosylase II
MLTPELVRDAAWGSAFEAGKSKQTVNGQTCGLSERKAIYLRSLATHFLDADLLGGDQDLDGIPEEALKNKLLAVQGIGEWTVHMFLLFNLQRQDVVALGDLGVRRGLAKLYGMSDQLWRKMKPDQFKPFIESWTPYSSLGCALMWRSDAVTMVSSSDRKEAGGKSKKRDRAGDAGPAASVGSKRKKISRE